GALSSDWHRLPRLGLFGQRRPATFLAQGRTDGAAHRPAAGCRQRLPRSPAAKGAETRT
ncbi:unknown, partial [Bacillus thuringiensis phage MZTP02]